MSMSTIRTFQTEQEARDYRHIHGTGGWIFSPENEQGGESVLFPPEMSPSDIFNHPITKGRTGNLIGNG